jgi:HlyD family secretion protein
MMDRLIEKKKWPLKKIIILSAAIGIPLFILVAFVISDKSTKLNVEKERITISEVKRAPFQEYIPISGTVEPFQTFFLDLSDGGRIVQKYVQEGAFLKAGDPIIKLDNPNLSLQLMSTQSSFLLAESQLRQTILTFEQNSLQKENQLLNLDVQLQNQKRLYNNAKDLFEKGYSSKNEYESNKEQYEFLLKSRELMVEVLKKDSLTYKQLVTQSETSIASSKSYLDLVKSQMDNLTVKAPIKGQLTSLEAEIGQSVGQGYKLGQIDNTDSYKIRAEIDEHYISRVHEGLLGDYDNDGKDVSLTVKTVYPQVINGKFYVDLIFNGNQPEGIRRGQTVHVKLQLGDSSEALLVENGGFYSTTGGQWIFIVNKSGSFAEKRQIKIGRQNPQYYEVLDGLKPGDKVITSSYENYGDIEKLILN